MPRDVPATHMQPQAFLLCTQDGLLDVVDASDWLDNKRTNIKLNNVEGKLGHMPQEDFAAALAPLLWDFLEGKEQQLEGLKRFWKADYEKPETERRTGDYVER